MLLGTRNSSCRRNSKERALAVRLETFAELVRAADDIPALRALFVDFFVKEGVAMVSYHHLPPIGADDYDGPITVAAHGFPKDWLQKYTADGLYETDPIPQVALSSTYPFWWSEARDHPGLTAAQLDFLDDLDRASLGEGLAAPLFGPHGRNGYAGLGCGGATRKWGPRKIARLHLAAQIGHQRYCDILLAKAPIDVRVSNREREILGWIARGKSNGVIADIVGVSPNTVDTYLRRLFQKLDVADRVTAALRGLAIGLID
ncbi:MAG: autoinducer binding domain-containing protein [Parvularculaceae bacterium]